MDSHKIIIISSISTVCSILFCSIEHKTTECTFLLRRDRKCHEIFLSALKKAERKISQVYCFFLRIYFFLIEFFLPFLCKTASQLSILISFFMVGFTCPIVICALIKLLHNYSSIYLRSFFLYYLFFGPLGFCPMGKGLTLVDGKCAFYPFLHLLSLFKPKETCQHFFCKKKCHEIFLSACFLRKAEGRQQRKISQHLLCLRQKQMSSKYKKDSFFRENGEMVNASVSKTD